MVLLVVNGEISAASQANSAGASIGNAKPEIAYFQIDLFDFSFFRPERRVFAATASRDIQADRSGFPGNRPAPGRVQGFSGSDWLRFLLR